ncbi:MAG: carbohydrate ABC transporter permease [Propionibacteriaceae bacterium]|jgi:multiple sugar transport system permease protein|nr:carbohydrate ABC transporter permease [Propionibacteriaceae bacterium]
MSAVRTAPPPAFAPSKFARSLTLIVLVVAMVYFMGPVIWLIIASSKSTADLLTTPPFAFSQLNWVANWQALMSWTGGQFPRWVINSVIYSSLAGVVGTMISLACGFAIAKYQFPGRKALLMITMTGLLMPVALLTVPLYVLFQTIGLANTPWAVIVPSLVSPFGLFLGRVYAEASVPTELLEAARVDGAGEVRIFFTIVLRLLGPAMLTIFLFIFVATWNNILLPLMMISSDNLKPVTLGLYGMASYYAPNKGAMMLGALLGVLPLVALFLALQRHWRAGLAAGAVKG